MTRSVRGLWMDSGSVVFDRYRLEERIGAGGMGVVWRATDLLLDQPVALKRVSLAGMDGQHAELTRGRALREARLAARLRQHRHVVATYDVRVEDGEVWLVLDYLPSQSLATILRKEGPLDPGRVARIGVQVADALAAAHAMGIEHRDVTPGNVLISDDGTARLTDFGVSRLAGDTQLTQGGVISGTFAYLAPEVARTGVSSPASDVFSLGSTLYAAIEGQPPFGTNDNALRLLSTVGSGIILPPSAAGDFTSLLMRLLALDPATRPDAATTRDLLDEFATQAQAQAQAPARDPEPAPQPRWWWPRYPVLPVAIALIIIAALAGSLLTVFWPSEPSGGPGPSSPTPPLPIGAPRSADPCGLLSVGSVQQFGQATMFHDFGYPQSCLIQIETGGEGFVNLWATFDVARDRAPSGLAERFGALTIYREAASDGECQRTLVLGDLSRVYVETFAGSGATTDLCAVADAGTQTAALALSSGSLPRRDITGPPNALTGLDTCSLLNQAALSQVPGLDATRQEPGFGGWLCTWGLNPAFEGEPWARVAVRRQSPLSGQPVQIGGRSAQVTPGGSNNPGFCEVDLVQRSYPGTSGNARVELLKFAVYLGDQQSTDAACNSAKALAVAAALNLPPA